MSRKLEFRAWSIGDEKYFYISDIGDVIFNYENDGSFSLFMCETGETLDSVFEQYAGLKDKNGVKIFEGDIVSKTVKRLCNPNDRWGGYKWVKESFTVVYDGQEFSPCSLNDTEIIGNIHENPELLEQKQ